MRVEICDVQIHTPTPALSKLLCENRDLKSKNNALEYIALGAIVAGLVCLVAYIDSQERMRKLSVRKKHE
jgi:hypothetical protein